MTHIPANVMADLKRRGLDVGYLDRIALSPFLRANGGRPDPVRSYMDLGKVLPENHSVLRQVAEQASTWTDSEVKAAGLTLLHILDEMDSSEAHSA